MAPHHITGTLVLPLALALTFPAWAGTATASMTVGVTIVDSCTVATGGRAPAVTCSGTTVPPQVSQHAVKLSEGSQSFTTKPLTESLTVVTY
ncbi:TPA: hypothetical protein QDB07_000793 [Burkholderia vietnamiensis]|nr:hypothetical protein [Burkholderia vietnamiensis]